MKRILTAVTLAGLALAIGTPSARADDTSDLIAAARAKAARTPGLGNPTADFERATAYGLAGVYRRYQHGVVAATTGGAFVVGSGIQSGWVPSWGWPTQDTQKVTRINGYTGFAQALARPSQTPSTAAAYRTITGSAYVVGGPMFARFTALGGLTGAGWPTGTETPLARCATTVQPFTRTGNLTPDSRWCPAAPYANPYLAQAGSGAGNVQYPGYNGTAVYLMQRAIGMDPGKITDRWGTKTQAALDAFMKKGGYPPVTKLDATVWSRLRSPSPFNVSTWVAPLGAGPSASRAQHVAAAIEFARSNLGTDYLWGGTGNPGRSVGYDCAGLVLQAYRAGGVDLTKVSNWYDQYPPSDLSNQLLHDDELQPVTALRSLLPGDLLFSGTYDRDGAGHARHVMMYIGNGMTIQAIHAGVSYVPLYTKGRLFTGGWPYLVGIRRPVASAQVRGTARAAAASMAAAGLRSPLASVPQAANATYWALNSWAVALPQQPSGPLERPGWQRVTAGSRVNATGGTLIFAGAGAAVGIVPSARGSYRVPAGAEVALLVSPSDGAGVEPGSPVYATSAG
ncbi:NlpC/P60 family protein [Branchiibius sp. NY16-3462-2]|uniref:NlpC/P60 family protein n=1 Tax=Branchiibius sp. NY16-3462-2 TaxID=1807500 RepID=UPI00079AEDE5|nr:NlpC/P60 family protein [Branchiibius sp. NY16-3462-2]KYH45470.1 hypothetical protein AZH51_00730 [Branchiibius sp. NY16-3462-2]